LPHLSTNCTAAMVASSLSQAVESTLAAHLDEDATDYVTSLLSEDPADEDAREAVLALVSGSIDDEEADPAEVCATFFQLLDFGSVGGPGDDDGDNNAAAGGLPKTPAPTRSSSTMSDMAGGGAGGLRKLTESVTLKEKDVTTFASGLSAAVDTVGGMEQQSQIADFYANMIDPSDNPAAMSERARRKARQKALREAAEDEDRRRAIEDAMKMLEDEGDDGDAELEDLANDNARDVHIRDFDLPNLRGGGPDLLSGASLILAHGRRYGLMGRNGCGKTTALTYIAGRQVNEDGGGGVPKNMSMLLVRQEIVGNEWSAVETVLKSDVKREGVKKYINWCEAEIERLENGGEKADGDEDGKEETVDAGKKMSKAKQRLREKKKLAAGKNKKDKSGGSKKAGSSNLNEDIEAQKSKLADKLAKAYQKLTQIEEEEGGDPEPRARKVLNGLGFSEDMMNKPTSELSGGWRMRVSLSCALFANPALLLLDEPTNHLDLEAVLWLEKYLCTKFAGTLVVVSHDRHFLNEVCTDIVHFYRQQLMTYRGDVSNFEAVREEEKQRQIRLYENQEKQKAHLQKYIDLHAQSGENGVKAARQRKSRMKKLDKIGMMSQEGKKFKASYDGDVEEIEEYQEDDKVELSFPDPGSFDGNMVTLEQVTFGYSPDKILLRNVDMTIDVNSRIALLGRNGCGKSTLIKLVVGALRPMKGKGAIDARTKIEYLAQHQLEQLDPDGTPMSTMLDRYPGDRGNQHCQELRNYLANFGLGGEVLPKQRVSTMSGGQKCRLCLACAMYRKPHLLILDEPTNHLDLETTEALIEALQQFNGGVLLVSHDQHLLTKVCKDLYVVENGTVERLQGGMANEAFEAYKKAIVQGRR